MASGGTRDVEVEGHLSRTIQSEFLFYAKSERAFLTSTLLENASTGDTSNLHLSNPSGSGVSAIFSLLVGSPSARSVARVYDEFSTNPSGGSSVEVDNVLLDSAGGAPDSGEVSAATDVSFSGSGTHAVDTVGGGEGAPSVGGSANMPVLALEPDREIVLEVEKTASDGNDVALTARWYEVPVVYSEVPEDPEIGEVTRGRVD